MDDLISKQAAIDEVDSETVSTNPEHFKSSERFIKFMDDADIVSFGKWQWANGFNTALVATKIQLKKLPSAQPDHFREVSKMVSFTEKERGMLKTMRTLHNGTYADLLDRLVSSAQEDADSAYIEGYTHAEAKYRALWDEIPEIIRCKDCKHADEYCHCSYTTWWNSPNDFCSKGERREQ